MFICGAGSFLVAGVSLERVQSLLEIKYFPEGHAQVQYTETCDCPSDPAGGNHTLQSIKPGLTRGIQQKIIVSPIAKAKKSLRNPGQQGEHDANLHAQDNVEDNA